jgi:hypothetical protein
MATRVFSLLFFRGDLGIALILNAGIALILTAGVALILTAGLCSCHYSSTNREHKAQQQQKT